MSTSSRPAFGTPRLQGEGGFSLSFPMSIFGGQKEATHRFAGKGLAGFIQKPYTLANLRETLRQGVPDKGEQIVQ